MSTGPQGNPKLTRPVILLHAALWLSACGEPSDPGDLEGPHTGTLAISTSTTGDDPDSDGYWLMVDEADSLQLDPSGTAEIELASGRHRLRLVGVADQCSASAGADREVDVTAERTTSVAFHVGCVGTGARITVRTTGLDLDPDGYRVMVDERDMLGITSNGTLLLRLDPGNRAIGLTRLAPNCTVAVPGMRTVIIVAGEVEPVEFEVLCTAMSGVIRVAISESGFGAGGVYDGLVDGERPFSVSRDVPTHVAEVPAGDHAVSLEPHTGCSVEDGSRSVTVRAGSLTRDTAEVVFSVVCGGPTRARIAFVRRPQPGGDGMPGVPEIYLANADGSGAARLISGESPAWSPDGRSIAFERDGAIHVIDADGSDDRALGQGGHPAWSPDGSRIAFHTGFNRDDGIFMMNADGSGLTRLLRRDFANPGSGDWIGWPEWSSAGTISFVRAPDYDSYEPWQIYVMNADGSDPRNLNVLRSIGGSFAEVQSWSPDGSRIALGVNPGEYWTVASVDSSGGDFRVHYRDEPGGYAAYPDWSPDGRSLVFERYARTSGCDIPSCPMRIFVVSAHGGPARQLIPEVEQGPAYWDHQPAWSHGSE
jgi:hypothetical protein